MSLRKLFRRPDAHPRGLRLFFCSDIHGSDSCFRKFLAAGDFYDVDHLILGGDMTGKLLIPIMETAGRYSARYRDETYTDIGRGEMEELRGLIRRGGHYSIVGTRERLECLEDDAERDKVFRAAVYDSIAEWVTLADERLRGSGRRCFVAPGNDDFLEIDSALQGSDVVVFAEGRRIAIDETHEMITTGYSNPTPWHTERELPERELKARIEGMAAGVSDFANLIAVLHPPPHRTELDSAPELDENLGMRMQAGGVVMTSVGSTAVRAFIEERQPLLALHGHVHEGRGEITIGRTLCINPGSEYTDGILSGAVVELGDGHVLRHQLVAG